MSCLNLRETSERTLTTTDLSNINELASVYLTNREREVAQFILQGMNNKAISKKLVIASSTVSCYVGFLVKKLRVRNRTGILFVLRQHPELLDPKRIKQRQKTQVNWRMIERLKAQRLETALILSTAIKEVELGLITSKGLKVAVEKALAILAFDFTLF